MLLAALHRSGDAGDTPSGDVADTAAPSGDADDTPRGDAHGAQGVTRTTPNQQRREQQETNNTRRRHTASAGIPIPAPLDTPAFRAAWGAWIDYRRDRRLTCSTATLRRQLTMLSEAGPETGAQIIDQSLRNGWQGLFELRAGHNGNGRAGRRHSLDVTGLCKNLTDGEAQ